MGRLAYGKSDISCSIVTPQAKIPDQPNRLYPICNRRHWLYLRLVCEWQTQSDLLLRGFIWLQFCKIVTFWSQRLLEIGTGRYRFFAVILRTKKIVSQNNPVVQGSNYLWTNSSSMAIQMKSLQGLLVLYWLFRYFYCFIDFIRGNFYYVSWHWHFGPTFSELGSIN